MKISDHFNKGPVQDLLNAVVVQAAEDYREYSAKLLVHPDDRGAAEGKEEVESFFLSEDFMIYTTLAGSYLLRKHEEEQKEVETAYLAYKAREADLLAEARQCAKLLMQWQKQEDDNEELLARGREQESRLHSMIADLQNEKRKLPKAVGKAVRVMSYETVMYKAYAYLKEDIRNGKEDLWSGSVSQPAESA